MYSYWKDCKCQRGRVNHIYSSDGGGIPTIYECLKQQFEAFAQTETKSGGQTGGTTHKFKTRLPICTHSTSFVAWRCLFITGSELVGVIRHVPPASRDRRLAL